MLERPKIELIPWDPESPQHIQRLFDQRIACGWKSDQVESWRPLQREGKMTIQWVVLASTSPNRDALLTAHTTQYPFESTPLLDTATTFGGQPRSWHQTKEIFPVGHISLDTFNPISPELANPDRGIYCISTFYISAALQSAGLGRATMDLIEEIATAPPLNAEVLALNTLAKEEYGRMEMWTALEMSVPKIVTQEWYERRGYRVFDGHEKAFKQVDKEGRDWWLKDAFMRKEVA